MLLNRNPLLSICRHNLTFTLSNFLFCHWYNGISQVCVSRFEPMPRNLYTGKTQNQSLYSLVIRFLYPYITKKYCTCIHFASLSPIHPIHPYKCMMHFTQQPNKQSKIQFLIIMQIRTLMCTQKGEQTSTRDIQFIDRQKICQCTQLLTHYFPYRDINRSHHNK